MLMASFFLYSVMAVMKQKNIRQAEKSLKDLLDKADNNANGKVELSDFLKILEAHGVEVVYVRKKLCSLNFTIWNNCCYAGFVENFKCGKFDKKSNIQGYNQLTLLFCLKWVMNNKCRDITCLTLNLVSFQVWSLFYPLKLNRYITGLFQTGYSKLVEFYPICSAPEHKSNL